MIDILDLTDNNQVDTYNKALNEIGISPYYLVDFYKGFASGLNDLLTLIVKEESFLFILPGYKRSIKGFEDYFDFISPYGYSGPLISKNASHGFISNAWAQVQEYFLTTNIISCFLRLSLDNEVPLFPGLINPTMLNIKGKIVEEPEQWRLYENKVRKNVKRAKSNNLVFAIKGGSEVTPLEMQDFHNIYVQTMTRTNAANSFFYPLQTFEDFALNSGNFCCFSFIYDSGTVVSCEMTLHSNECMYSFLGGTLEESFDKRPNDLLKHELINWGRNNGYKYFILGGGFGSNDGIFRYKKSFFPYDVVDYCTGRWIINEDRYSEIVEYWFKKNANSGNIKELQEKDFFPEYRKFIF